jgi:hypothetical protein
MSQTPTLLGQNEQPPTRGRVVNFRTKNIHGRWHRSLACICALSATAACGGNGGDGAGGSGGGPGGSVTSCVVTADAVIADNGNVPHIIQTDAGYMVALLVGGEVTVVALDESGAVLHSTAISASSGNAKLPTVAANASGFTALWARDSDIVMRPLDASGKPSGPEAVIASTASTEPRPDATTTGSAVAVTWMDGAAVIAGILSGSTLSQVSSVTGAFPAIAASKEGAVAVAWNDGDIGGGPVRLGSLDAMDSAMTVPGSGSLIKSITALDQAFVVAWEEVGGGAEEVRVARIGVGGAVVAEATVSPADGSANWPAVAWSGSRLAVAYYQFRAEGSPSVFVSFYDGALKPVDNEVAVAEDAKYPSAAWGPNGVAVAYALQAGPVKVSLVTCP